MNKNLQNIVWAFFYFLGSLVISWWYIKKAELLYFSEENMIGSCLIAGAKWGLQIIAALLFLKEKKWQFIHLIGLVCFIGSCTLLPYCMFYFVRMVPLSFLVSLICAVMLMIAIYYKVVIKVRISKRWFWGWICCLAVAISLQIFVVFKIQL